MSPLPAGTLLQRHQNLRQELKILAKPYDDAGQLCSTCQSQSLSHFSLSSSLSVGPCFAAGLVCPLRPRLRVAGSSSPHRAKDIPPS